MIRTVARIAGVGVAALGLALALGAAAQGFDPRAPHTTVVGGPRGDAPMARVNAYRDGRARAPLPIKKIHVAWKRSTGAPIEGPPLVDESGRVIVVGTRGDVVFLSPDGEERARAATGASGPGPLALTADGTVVFVSSGGDIVGARGTTRRFSVRLGIGSSKVAPLPLHDGGFAVALGSELVLLDTEGQVRARAQSSEPLAGPLVAVGARILGASRSGTVFSWAPGGEVVRVGSFRAPIDGGLVVEDGVRVLAVTDGRQLTELELSRGAPNPRGTAAPGSLYLGPPALSPTGAVLFGASFGATYLVLLDRAGQETRVSIGAASATPPPLLPDGGTPPLLAPVHTGPLVDARGTIAFVTPDGLVGVASHEAGVSILAEAPCARTASGKTSVLPGIAPAGPSAFVVACESGTVVKIVGEPP